MPEQRRQHAPDQRLLVLDRAAEGADHVAQVEAARRHAVDRLAVGAPGVHVRLAQVGVLLDVEQEEVDGGRDQRVDPLLGGGLEGNLDTWWHLALFIDQIYKYIL